MTVGVAVLVWVKVAVAVRVGVGDAVAVPVGDCVAVRVAVSVDVAEEVFVGVEVRVGDAVGETVGGTTGSTVGGGGTVPPHSPRASSIIFSRILEVECLLRNLIAVDCPLTAFSVIRRVTVSSRGARPERVTIRTARNSGRAGYFTQTKLALLEAWRTLNGGARTSVAASTGKASVSAHATKNAAIL